MDDTLTCVNDRRGRNRRADDDDEYAKHNNERFEIGSSDKNALAVAVLHAFVDPAWLRAAAAVAATMVAADVGCGDDDDHEGESMKPIL